MEAAVQRMEAQLELWGQKIEKLAAKTQKAGDRAGFEDVMYLDELKALYAIARSKFEKFRAAQDTERVRLKAEMKIAWNELHAAFSNPFP